MKGRSLTLVRTVVAGASRPSLSASVFDTTTSTRSGLASAKKRNAPTTVWVRSSVPRFRSSSCGLLERKISAKSTEREGASDHHCPGHRPVRVAADHRRDRPSQGNEDPDPKGRADRHHGATQEQPDEEERVRASLLPRDALKAVVELTLCVFGRFVQQITTTPALARVAIIRKAAEPAVAESGAGFGALSHRSMIANRRPD